MRSLTTSRLIVLTLAAFAFGALLGLVRASSPAEAGHLEIPAVAPAPEPAAPVPVQPPKRQRTMVT